MSPLWGAKSGKEKKPTSLTQAEKEQTYATSRGWEIERKAGRREILVAVSQLRATLGSPNISSVRLEDRAADDSNLVFYVSFNTPVSVSGTPYFFVNAAGLGYVTANNISNTANVTYLSGNNTPTLVFNYAPVSGDNNEAAATITMSPNIYGTIIDANSSSAASLSFLAGNGDEDVRLDLSDVVVIKA